MQIYRPAEKKRQKRIKQSFCRRGIWIKERAGDEENEQAVLY